MLVEVHGSESPSSDQFISIPDMIDQGFLSPPNTAVLLGYGLDNLIVPVTANQKPIDPANFIKEGTWEEAQIHIFADMSDGMPTQ